MSVNPHDRHPRYLRRVYLLAVLLLTLACTMAVGAWQVPQLIGQLPSWFAPQPAEATVAAVSPTTSAPAEVTSTLAPRPVSTEPLLTHATAPVLAASHPTISETWVEVNGQAGTIVFGLTANVLQSEHIADVFLWYDTEKGRQAHHFAGPLPPSLALRYQLDARQEGLTAAQFAGETQLSGLDYWWLVRDTTGESARAGGTVALGPVLQRLVVTPAPALPLVDFTWAVSESPHYRFHFVPGSAAERDVHRIGVMAEAALARTCEMLEVEFDGKMYIYLVPRIFWQGAATYGDKVQLISYLDRNYTAVETWSYFTHEGTHALAQDLAQAHGRPKEEGGPDGVLIEGLAVWASGGHYRREPLDAWAAAVAASDEYIPLAELRTGPFYDFQHEISYLEAASFVKFLIGQYGLDRLKELYGLASGEAAHDEALVERLYGQGYDHLEAAWLDYLAGLEPAPEEAKTWRLTHRSFDLMRRYETEMDPDARILPSSPPPEWTTDTLKIFLHRLEKPANVVLETALIAAQERLYGGDLGGAAGLMDDVEAALDAGGSGEGLDLPSLNARRAILKQVAAQDRAVLRADAGAYLSTVRSMSTLALDRAWEEKLQPPLSTYRQEVVRLDLGDDGLNAWGVVLVHAKLADKTIALEPTSTAAGSEDGNLYAVRFIKASGDWFMTDRKPVDPALAPLPSVGE